MIQLETAIDAKFESSTFSSSSSQEEITSSPLSLGSSPFCTSSSHKKRKHGKIAKVDEISEVETECIRVGNPKISSLFSDVDLIT